MLNWQVEAALEIKAIIKSLNDEYEFGFIHCTFECWIEIPTCEIYKYDVAYIYECTFNRPFSARNKLLAGFSHRSV